MGLRCCRGVFTGAAASRAPVTCGEVSSAVTCVIGRGNGGGKRPRFVSASVARYGSGLGSDFSSATRLGMTGALTLLAQVP